MVSTGLEQEACVKRTEAEVHEASSQRFWPRRMVCMVHLRQSVIQALLDASSSAGSIHLGYPRLPNGTANIRCPPRPVSLGSYRKQICLIRLGDFFQVPRQTLFADLVHEWF